MQNLSKIISMALEEDIGWGDVTTDSCIPVDAQISGYFLAKQDLVVCGLAVISETFLQLNKQIVVQLKCSDGDFVKKGETIATVQGLARPILTGERTALNLLQRMSGIATRTREITKLVKDYKTIIVDTRKTTPGLRVLEKYAVRIGGGGNHRMGLSDGVLIKDNHISAAGSIANAVNNARKYIPHTLKIEVETSNIDEVRQALDAKADIIMLDNMTDQQMIEAVKLTAGKALTEASGNMDTRDIVAVAKIGVDLISIGALTHTVRAADISLKLNSLT